MHMRAIRRATLRQYIDAAIRDAAFELSPDQQQSLRSVADTATRVAVSNVSDTHYGCDCPARQAGLWPDEPSPVANAVFKFALIFDAVVRDALGPGVRALQVLE